MAKKRKSVKKRVSRVKIKSKLKQKNKGLHKSSIFLSISILLILTALAYIISDQTSNEESENTGPRLSSLKDECSMIAGKLIHKIRDAEDCELQCKNHCNSQELTYSYTNFTASESDCHDCNCYCE